MVHVRIFGVPVAEETRTWIQRWEEFIVPWPSIQRQIWTPRVGVDSSFFFANGVVFVHFPWVKLEVVSNHMFLF